MKTLNSKLKQLDFKQLNLSIKENLQDIQDKDWWRIQEAVQEAVKYGTEVSDKTIYRRIEKEKDLKDSEKSIRWKLDHAGKKVVHLPDVKSITLLRKKATKQLLKKKATKQLLKKKPTKGSVPVNWPVTEKDVAKRLGFFKKLVGRIDRRPNPRNREVDIYYINTIGYLQGWKCALSGEVLEFEPSKTGSFNNKPCNPKICTIDRKDSNLDYVKGNIQLVCHDANSYKGCESDIDYINTCKRVAANAESGRYDLLNKIVSKLT